MRSIHYSKEYIPNRKEYPRNSKRAWPKHGQEKTRGQQIEEESCPNVLRSAARYPSEQQAQQTKTRKNSDLNTLTHMFHLLSGNPTGRILSIVKEVVRGGNITDFVREVNRFVRQ